MKYKKGDKFIIEVEGVREYPMYRICQGQLMYESTLDLLEPYDESAAYQRGLDDAWEAARKVFGMTIQELYDAFGEDGLCLLQKTTVAEALARIRAYEESQEIHVGDEVERDGITGVVTNVYEVGDHPKETFVNVLYSGGNSMCSCRAASVKKKKRNFPEVAALLDKMKGDTPDV